MRCGYTNEAWSTTYHSCRRRNHESGLLSTQPGRTLPRPHLQHHHRPSITMTGPFPCHQPTVSNFPLVPSHHSRVARQVLPLCSLSHAVICPTSPTAHESSHRPVCESMSLSGSGSWHPFRASFDYREHQLGVRYRAVASLQLAGLLPCLEAIRRKHCSHRVAVLSDSCYPHSLVPTRWDAHKSSTGISRRVPFFATTSSGLCQPHMTAVIE
jgi:hypothetical protein